MDVALAIDQRLAELTSAEPERERRTLKTLIGVVKRVGERTFPLLEEYVDRIVAVEEDAIAVAVHLLIERQKLVAEGAGA